MGLRERANLYFSSSPICAKLRIMKKNQYLIIFVFIVSAVAVSCSNAPQQTQQTANANTAVITKANNDSPLVASSHGSSQSSIAHSADQNQPKSSAPSTESAPPMMGGNAQAIDTTELDAAIAKADKDYKAKPNDEAAKKALANAYAKRAFALTNAAQYRAALGDFRKCLKLDPTNTEAKDMHDQIVSIFESMGREMPAEGQEPTPLPFKKGA